MSTSTITPHKVGDAVEHDGYEVRVRKVMDFAGTKFYTLERPSETGVRRYPFVAHAATSTIKGA